MAPNEALKSWLGKRDIPAAEFARRVEYDRSNFHNILEGYLRPSLSLAARIERQTDGEILATAWADYELKTRPKRADESAKAA